jgi:tetratricopeptide (TPR) repeat protein
MGDRRRPVREHDRPALSNAGLDPKIASFEAQNLSRNLVRPMAQFQPQSWQDDAKSYMDRHDWAGAIPSLERDIAEHPPDPWSRMFLGSCYLELKHYGRALEQFRAAEALAPHLSTAVGCQGDVLCDTGDWEAAGEFYRRALEMNPSDELAIEKWKWWASEMAKGT